MLKEFTQNDTFEEVTKEGLVLVDFSAGWCGPCQMIHELLEQIDNDKSIDVQIVTVDVDENNKLASSLRIMNIPTLMLFKDGELINKHVGYMPLAALKDFINK